MRADASRDDSESTRIVDEASPRGEGFRDGSSDESRDDARDDSSSRRRGDASDAAPTAKRQGCGRRDGSRERARDVASNRTRVAGPLGPSRERRGEMSSTRASAPPRARAARVRRARRDDEPRVRVVAERASLDAAEERGGALRAEPPSASLAKRRVAPRGERRVEDASSSPLEDVVQTRVDASRATKILAPSTKRGRLDANARARDGESRGAARHGGAAPRRAPGGEGGRRRRDGPPR